MKKVLPLIMLLLSAVFAVAQSITLNFTAVDQNGNPHDFTSVKIENLTRGWQHTLDYSESVIEIPVSVGVGELEGQTGGLRLAGPNPFNGTAYAELQLTEAGPVELMAIQLDGKLVARCEGYLPSGVHRIKFDAMSPQMYLLVAKTNQGSHIVKLMSVGNGSGNGIVLEKSVVSFEKGGSASSELGYFELGDEMRFTAYNGNEISEALTLALLEGGTITLTFNTDAPIVSGGRFSVSANTRVDFAPGNLQYQAGTSTWRFAENQWDYVGATMVGLNIFTGTIPGSSNHLVSDDYPGWIDLFCWGTGNNPTSTDPYDSDFNTFVDWGSNPISNGGNTANQWRTLSKDEWQYLLFDRATASDIRFAKATVNGVKGTIVVPDAWQTSFYTLSSVNEIGADFSTNVISAEEWTSAFEVNGAVFLPVAGRRHETSVIYTDSFGNYWTTTNYDGGYYAWYLSFSSSDLIIDRCDRSNALSVRLVTEVVAVQSIMLSFTAVDLNSNPHEFTSVKIENLTRNWQHTLNYPDSDVVIQVTNDGKLVSMSRELGQFKLGDKMRFTAYDGEESSQALTQPLYESGTITLKFGDDTPVEPSGRFSIGSNTRINFSPGNLQYQPSSNTWRFAENQWDYVGTENEQISSSYTGWIDLFGWGTGNNPTNASTNNSDYTTFTDWGINPISNGGGMANQWRTLKYGEWNFILFYRATVSCVLFAKATVNGVAGVILLPDNWSTSYYMLNSPNMTDVDYTTNTISSGDWMNNFEVNGAVFLPAAGYRNGTTLNYDGFLYSRYWTASSVTDFTTKAWSLYFGDNYLYLNYGNRYYGHSVRLIADE